MRKNVLAILVSLALLAPLARGQGLESSPLRQDQFTLSQALGSLSHGFAFNQPAQTEKGLRHLHDLSIRYASLSEYLPNLTPRSLPAHAGGVDELAITPGGTRLVSKGRDNNIKVWDLATGSLLKTIPAPPVYCGLSPDGERYVTEHQSRTSPRIRIWNVLSGQMEQTLEPGFRENLDHPRTVFSRDGRTMMILGLSNIDWIYLACIWNLESEQNVNIFATGRPVYTAAQFSPDGSAVAIGNTDGNICVRTLPTGHYRHNFLDGKMEISALAFLPDSSHLVSGSDTGAIKLWNLASGRLDRSLEGHQGRVTALQPFSDSARFLSGGADGLMVIWDLASSSKFILGKHHDAVTSITLASDNRTMASGGAEGSIKIWQLPVMGKNTITRAGFESAVPDFLAALSARNLDEFKRAFIKGHNLLQRKE